MADGTLTQTEISTEHANPDPTRALRLAAHQMSELIEQDALSIPAMRAIMWSTHGGSDAEGAWDWRAAYDCAEAGLLLALKRDPEFDLSSREVVPRQISLVEDLLASMPTQTRRSEDQMRMQQFSTPVPLALLMAAAAELGQGAQKRSPCSKQKGEIAEKEDIGGARGAPSPTDLTAAPVASLTVLEPSAGCGALAMLAQKAGCVTFANELDPRRRALCAQVLDQNVSGVDAEFIANADFAQDVDRVLINPPFSSSKARAGDSSIAIRHAISAMACLKDGGRLVAILPDGAFGPRQSKWLTKLLDHAQVRLHVALPRSAFAKSGTSIPTRLLVLDKDSSTSAVPTCHHVDTMAESAQRIAKLAPAPLAISSAGQAVPINSAAAAASPNKPTQPSAKEPANAPTSPQPQSSSSAMKVIPTYWGNEGECGAATALKPEARGSEQAVDQVRNHTETIQPRLKLLPGATRKMPGKAVASTSTGTENARSSVAALSYSSRDDGAIAPENNADEAALPATATQSGTQNTAAAGTQGDAGETAAVDLADLDDAAQIS